MAWLARLCIPTLTSLRRSPRLLAAFLWTPWPLRSSSTSRSAFLGWIHPPWQSLSHHPLITLSSSPMTPLALMLCLQSLASSRQFSLCASWRTCSLLTPTCHYPRAAHRLLLWFSRGSLASCLHSLYTPGPQTCRCKSSSWSLAFFLIFSPVLKILSYFPIAPEFSPTED